MYTTGLSTSVKYTRNIELLTSKMKRELQTQKCHPLFKMFTLSFLKHENLGAICLTGYRGMQ